MFIQQNTSDAFGQFWYLAAQFWPKAMGFFFIGGRCKRRVLKYYTRYSGAVKVWWASTEVVGGLFIDQIKKTDAG